MEYISVDVESTGLSCKTDSIIEVSGWHIIDGVPVGKFTELIKPPNYIPRFIESKTGITQAMVKDARSLEEVLPEFLSFCGELPIIGYNVGFDYRMISEKAKNLGYDFTLDSKRRGLDVYKLVKKYLSNLPSKKLGDIVEYMGISAPMGERGLHSAEYDSYVTKLIFDAFIAMNADVKFTYLDSKSTEGYGEAINEDVLSFT